MASAHGLLLPITFQKVALRDFQPHFHLHFALKPTLTPLVRTLYRLLVLFGTAILASCHATAADQESLPLFFQNYCVRCHNLENLKGEFRLDTATTNAEEPSFGHVWGHALERINSGEMPPADEPQPMASERYEAAEWIAKGLRQWDAARYANIERVSFKKLTRDEYVNTLQDLLGYTYHPNDPGGLPEDPNWRGIERLGNVLSLTPSHIERYMAAAETALLNTIPLTDVPKPWHYEWTAPGIISWQKYQENLQNKVDVPKHRLLIGPANNWKHYVGGLNQISLPSAGTYRIRVGASGLRPAGGSAPHMVLYDATIDRTLMEVDVDAPEDRPTVLESTVWLPKGTHDLVLRNELPGPSPYEPHARGGNVDIFTTLRHGRSPFLKKLSDDNFQPYVPMLILDTVHIEAVIDPWPPRTQQAIMLDGAKDSQHALAILSKFAERAFRRPVSPVEIKGYLSVAKTAQSIGLTFEQGVREALLSILSSHDFLFLVEGSTEEPRRNLSDFELASRLSYFVWSTMPDEQLFERARKGEFNQQKVLLEEISRMLADPRSQRLAFDFSRQWLQLGEVGKFPPDKKLYPHYDAGLQRSMVLESRTFFDHALRTNLSLRDFLDSDWTMLNNRLAEHYGIPGVVDFAMHPVNWTRGSIAVVS